LATVCYLDTNIFLNVIYAEPLYSKGSYSLLQRIQEGKLAGITSSVTETEIGLDMAKTGSTEKIDEALRLLERMQNLEITSLSSLAARLALRLVLERRLTVHDAYHVATALEGKASVFVTRDRHLQRKLQGLLYASEPERIDSDQKV